MTSIGSSDLIQRFSLSLFDSMIPDAFQKWNKLSDSIHAQFYSLRYRNKSLASISEGQ